MRETSGITIGTDLEALMRARYAHPDDETMANIAEGARKGMTIGAIIGAGVTGSGGPFIASQSKTLVRTNTKAWSNGRKIGVWLSTNYQFEDMLASTLQTEPALKRSDEMGAGSALVSRDISA
jgi:hypothetical protein